MFEPLLARGSGIQVACLAERVRLQPCINVGAFVAEKVSRRAGATESAHGGLGQVGVPLPRAPMLRGSFVALR
jgi:hypothetical protein